VSYVTLIEAMQKAPGSCLCIAYDDETGELIGWRPCPPSLCERPGHGK
jgi:hypothetical protein